MFISEGTNKILSQYGEGQIVIIQGLRTETIHQAELSLDGHEAHGQQTPISSSGDAHVGQTPFISAVNRGGTPVGLKRKRESLGDKEEEEHELQKRKVEPPRKAFLNLGIGNSGKITIRKYYFLHLSSFVLHPLLHSFIFK